MDVNDKVQDALNKAQDKSQTSYQNISQDLNGDEFDIDTLFGSSVEDNFNSDKDPFADIKQAANLADLAKEQMGIKRVAAEQGLDLNQPKSFSNISGTAEQLAKQIENERLAREAAENRLKDYESVANFVTSLYEDQTLRHAFISELEPDLLKPRNPQAFVKEALEKEFGKDFAPSKEERDDPSSPSYYYYLRANELYNEVRTKQGKTPDSLKKILEEKRAAKQAIEEQGKRDKYEIITEMKWTENDYNRFVRQAQKLKPIHVAKMISYAEGRRRTTSKQTAPNLVNTYGGRPAQDNQYFQELDAFFGK